MDKMLQGQRLRRSISHAAEQKMRLIDDLDVAGCGRYGYNDWKENHDHNSHHN